MPTLDLQPKHLRVLLDLLRQNVPDAEVWAYGSRVNHTAHETSDLDLVIRNPERLDAPLKNLPRLRDALWKAISPSSSKFSIGRGFPKTSVVRFNASRWCPCPVSTPPPNENRNAAYVSRRGKEAGREQVAGNDFA